MSEAKSVTVLRENVWTSNPIFMQVLGICSALAVTNLLINTVIMTLGVTLVTGFSSLTVSLLKKLIPRKVRMIIQTLIIAFYVIIVDLVLRAYMPDVSKNLGPYVGLIITNCIIMGRAEAFAQSNGPFISFWDGITSGLGYMGVLLLVAVVRELLGFGTLLGYQIMPPTFLPWTIMVMAPSAFFILAIIIWIGKSIQMRQGKGATA
ncbi:MAG TPA: NADH:ubiquinone reductase (Na(+)-transporting) subunit D [Spirochaetia bacterium]|nr:NADH:ubiquinone reductase (Na(+)-transporting) subunit D [Spirochaetia bacterium]